MPMTSCGTTWPMERIKSYFSSITRRFTSTLTGSVHRPSVISARNSPGTSPNFTTSVRQLCTIIFS